MFAISTVERDTGIGRDTLRIWERRYGFPAPERNGKGERIYSAEQIRRLRRIRRVLDLGLRPGNVVPLNDAALSALSDKLPAASSGRQDIDPAHASLIARTSSGDITALTVALEQALARDGLRAFVLHTFAPLSSAIGELWAGGELEVFEEHLLTRHMVHFLDVAMGRVGRPPGDPEVLLATLPGEQHALGLLMAEALLLHAGRATLNLGTDVPLDQIVSAVEQSRVTTVGLSFSSCYARGSIRDDLEELADRLPRGVAVWIGGAGAARLRRLPPAVERMSLESI